MQPHHPHILDTTPVMRKCNYTAATQAGTKVLGALTVDP